jgi:hypothetical protein
MVLIFRPSIRMRDTLRLFMMALNSEPFAASSGVTLTAGRGGYLSSSGVGSPETLAAGRGTARGLICEVGSAGANELLVYRSDIRTAKAQSTAEKRIPFKGRDLRRRKTGRPLPSMKRFSSYTPRRMF